MYSPGRQKIGPYRSQVVSKVLDRRWSVKRRRSLVLWSMLNLFAGLLLLYDLKHGLLIVSCFSDPLLSVGLFLWYGECCLAVFCLVNLLGHLIRLVLLQFPTVVMTSRQSALLQSPADGSSVQVSDAYTGGLPPKSNGPFAGDPIPASTPVWSRRYRTSPSRQVDITPEVVQRRRRTSSPLQRAPLSGEDSISDQSTLAQYLRIQGSRERRMSSQEAMQLPSITNSPVDSPQRWSFSSPGELSPERAQYQIASRSPPLSGDRSSTDGVMSSGRQTTDVWRSVGVSRDRLDYWTENLRRWLKETILSPLISEIDEVNLALSRSGCADLQIGVASGRTLQQAGLTNIARQLPNMPLVLRYLEVSSNQEYLVTRIRQLGADSCLSSFRWEGGGRWNSSEWSQALPTDTAIVVHLLGTYLDSQLPPNPRFPHGCTFSRQYMTKVPAKPSGDSNTLFLHQAQLFPPHFQVFVNGQVHDVGKGRSNLFHSILFFLYHVKHQECCMLGNVNLALSGPNILDVLANR